MSPAFHAALETIASPQGAAVVALIAATLLLVLDRRTEPVPVWFGPFAVLATLAGIVAFAAWAEPSVAPLAIGLVIAALARDTGNPLHGECGIKLLWVLGGSLALSWLGVELLALATGSVPAAEQWSVLELDLVPRMAWSTSLSLAMLVGVVLLGGAPFHFWVGDLFQGARPWIAPLGVAALQIAGAAWLARRLEGIAAFPEGREVALGMLEVAAAVAFVAGAATLLGQRRPERRVGTLASLQGGLLLARFASLGWQPDAPDPTAGLLLAWAAHLAVALSGAATLAHFLPVPAGPAAAGGTLFRRHPVTGLVADYATLSLAGAPGTPGSLLWLETARELFASGHGALLLALALAWFAAFSTGVQQLREAFGAANAPRPERGVPWEARAAMWISGAALAALAVAWWRK